MNKWGVRLISCYFFVWAISDVYKLATGTSSNKFFGFYFSSNGENLAFMAWAEVVALAYIGFQLLRFHPGGRYWSLAVLWLMTLEAGGFLIWMIVLLAKDFFEGKSSGLAWNCNCPIWHGEVRGLPAVLLYFVVVFIFIFIPTYFLMRKDVKQLFEKAVATVENTPNSEAPMP